MAIEAYYDLENNYNDTSGNAVHASAAGAGITFSGNEPIALTGEYRGEVFTDTNHISVPTTVYDNMLTSGTIKVSIFIRHSDTAGKVPVGSVHGVYGNFYIIWSSTITVAIPTSTGIRSFASASGLWKRGRWYTLYVCYNSGNLEVYLKDESGGTATKIIDQTPMSGGSTANFASCTNVDIGRAANVGGYAWGSLIDNVEFFSGDIQDDGRTKNTQLVFMGVGHSYVPGYLSSDGNGYRGAAYERWRDYYRKSNYFTGIYNSGDLICPYHSGVNGSHAADLDTNINTYLADAFLYPGSGHAVLLGPIEYNDKTAATALADFNASIDSIINKIDAYSSDIKIFIIVGPETLADISEYCDEMRTAYADALAAGKNVYLIDLYNQNIEIGGDNIHPTDAGYAAMGLYIANQVEALTTSTISMSEYIKKSNLQPNMTAEFQLNLGTSLDTAQDITRYIINLSDVTEKLSKSSTNSGGVVLPNMKIKLKNDRGLWDKLGGFFKEGFINNSVIKFTTKYTTPDGDDITPSYIYQGIIKYTTSTWDRNNFIFETTLTPSSSLLASQKIAPGTLANNTFKEICYKILNRTPFTRYLTIDKTNFTMGWDIAATDSISEMTNKKVKDVLDKIMLLTGSVYYVNYDQEFIIAPITPTSPTAVYTFRADDIFSIMSEGYYWKGHYTAITWDDDENTVQRVEMSYPDRDLYQYDFTELTLKEKYVTDTTNRTTILNNLLSLYKFLKRQVKIVCKWNPEVLVNTYISLDIAEEAIAGDEYLVWNKDDDQWNDGKYWGLNQPGITFDSNGLWRVTDVKRNISGDKMDLTIVQYQSDDEV